VTLPDGGDAADEFVGPVQPVRSQRAGNRFRIIALNNSYHSVNPQPAAAVENGSAKFDPRLESDHRDNDQHRDIPSYKKCFNYKKDNPTANPGPRPRSHSPPEFENSPSSRVYPPKTRLPYSPKSYRKY